MNMGESEDSMYVTRNDVLLLEFWRRSSRDCSSCDAVYSKSLCEVMHTVIQVLMTRRMLTANHAEKSPAAVAV